MYADLEKIEERGKKKKKGFSLFGRGKDEDNDSGKEDVEQFADLKPAADEQAIEPVSQPEEIPEPEPTPPPKAEPIHPPTPRPTVRPSSTLPPKAVQKAWQPLTGRGLEDAQHRLKDYKRKLNKAFIAKKLTQQQCIIKVASKEIELGLKPSK